jgi:secondary thiamine-phosphate synthase enzyme|tara:strand:- start:36 stop:455 length:420 start_codon:yes stop_codon:yes gene_type:complete
MWIQKDITLPQYSRGFHIITDEVIRSISEVKELSVGIIHIFIKHTSASLAINEGADPAVRIDFETFFNKSVPENSPDFIHNDEGPDDMPAHIKSAILGSSLSIPIRNGKADMGTWQDVYLCEHRNNPTRRKLTITVQGE